MGVCLPSLEKESGVRFRMAMRWVLRVGRVDVRIWEGCEVEGSEVKRVKGVKGEIGTEDGGSDESWTEKSTRMLGWGRNDFGIKL